MDTSKFDELVGHLAMFLLHQASPHTPVSVELRVAVTVHVLVSDCGGSVLSIWCHIQNSLLFLAKQFKATDCQAYAGVVSSVVPLLSTGSFCYTPPMIASLQVIHLNLCEFVLVFLIKSNFFLEKI